MTADEAFGIFVEKVGIRPDPVRRRQFHEYYSRGWVNFLRGKGKRPGVPGVPAMPKYSHATEQNALRWIYQFGWRDAQAWAREGEIVDR